ncbi:YMGG-like glycine zipper-containing protein [Pseudomonas sp. PP3]|uniref:YMGG-like glycine zipper-containing protein n=1 Tax=Pseudomonas sp. PP3 TaxID=2815936 RepID=UPI001BAFE2E0|nr:YMGG-like glycine zipper-containing protein [Pseudomonas sp. PP3]
MNRLSPIGLCVALSFFSVPGWAQTVVPMKGQSSQQTQTDITECNNIAASQTASTSSTPSGGRIKGAAAGAAAGATAAQVRGRQHDEFYDRVDDDNKQDYRQDRAKQTAAAGAVVGGSRQRQERRAQDKTNTANTATAYTSCLQGKGYQVNP